MNADILSLSYLVAMVFFIFGLKGLSSPRTAVMGNKNAIFGMLIAFIATCFHPDIHSFEIIALGLVGGAILGSVLALKIEMTAMPQLVAILHSFVGFSAVCVAAGTYGSHREQGLLTLSTAVELGLGAMIGALTFTGSIVAFAKLQELLASAPLRFMAQKLVQLLVLITMLLAFGHFIVFQDIESFIVLNVTACVLGVLLVASIGGADMPVVVSLLNSYSGWTAAATGFTLHNPVLIGTGAIVGSSGAILSYIMCKAMNRSLWSVIFASSSSEVVVSAGSVGRKVQSASPEDVGFFLGNCSNVIIVPGYGMAVAQAQHVIKELMVALNKISIDVRFAIHPVAGRMPGHMNVLLAESDIPYDVVFEMDEINNEFSQAQVVLVIGANDVVNPAAKSDKTSPLYGMPILDVYKSQRIFMLKRSMKSGYAGVDNELFYHPNCSLVFGDAKVTCEQILESLTHAI